VTKGILATLIVLAFLLVLVPVQVEAGPYMGGYLKENANITDRVLVTVNYAGTQADQIPYYTHLMGVSSIAGGSGLSPSGWTYQNVVGLMRNNHVYWQPQGWYENSQEYPGPIWDVGRGYYLFYYERMDIAYGKVIYTLYVYQDSTAYNNDEPTYIYLWSHPTSDSNFLVGRQWHSGNWYKHFQFGVESEQAFTTTNWQELNAHACYYDGADWRYTEGRVCHGDTALITWTYQGWAVGGSTYDGVNKTYSFDDWVCWNYSGTTIPDDSQLWSGSGIVSDTVFKPYHAGILKGAVSFAGRGAPPNDRWIEPFEVKLFEPGNLDNVLWEGTATTNNTGVFNITDLTPGTYDIGIKNWTCLSELETGVDLSGEAMVDFGTTREGDANDDDYINILDSSALSSAFGSSEGDPNWNPHCDFNRDGHINILDASILASNYGQHGNLR